MNIHIHPYLASYWLLIIVLKLALVPIVWLREWRGRVQFFRLYVTATACRSLLLFAVSGLGWAWAYTYIFWIGSGVLHGLAFGTAYEISRQLFYPYRRLPKSFLLSVISIIAFIFTGVMVTAVCFPAAVSLTELSAELFTIDRTLAILLCSMYWLISFASDWLRIPWHRRLYGMGVGFLFLYSVDLFVATARTVLHWKISTALWPIGFTVDLVCTAVWLFYFTRRRPDVAPVDNSRLEELQSFLRLFDAAHATAPRDTRLCQHD